jgi:KDO2-lipid IV(A) lauroyltransferase
MTRWKKFRYRLEALGCQLLAWGIPRLSRQRCIRLANFVGEVAFRLDSHSRAIALANLECAFGDTYSEKERHAIAAASFRNFARTMLELFWVQRLTHNNHAKWLVGEGMERVTALMQEKGVGAVFMCVHQGNWEMANAYCGFQNHPNLTVAENFKNQALTEIFRKVREKGGARVIAQENSILRMLRAVKRGESVGMMIDLSVHPQQSATVLRSFGRFSSTPLIHAALAQRAGALLVPIETEPLPDGTCLVRVQPPVEWPENASTRQIAQLCWDRFEPAIRKRPWEYLWSYKHFRHRPKSADCTYPFYANSSSHFEKLLRSVAAEEKNGAA